MRPWFLALICAVWAWAATAQEFTTLKGHGGPVMGIAVSASGRVATASFDNSLGLWTGREPQWLDGHEAAVNCLAFAAADTLLSGGDDFTVRRWTPEGNEVIIRHKGKVTSIAYRASDETVASASWDGTFALWSPGQEPRVTKTHAGGVNDVAFSPDGQVLYVATATGSLLAYDPAGKAAPIPLVKEGFGINRIVVGPDGDWIAYGAVDGGTRVVDAKTGTSLADLTLERRPILALAHHAQTGQLAVGDGQGYIMMVDTDTWKITRDFRATRHGPVWALAFSGDGSVVYAGGLDDVAYGWPVALMDSFDPAIGEDRSYLRDAATMPNGERQFMRKCSICHALTPGASRKAGPTLHGVFGRRAGTVAGYSYSRILTGSDIIWSATTIDALFDLGPDHYIPGSKMPMQRITSKRDRQDLIEFLQGRTSGEN